MRNLARFLGIFLLLSCPLDAAWAEPQAVGGILSLSVNDADSNFGPAIASDSRGGYAAVWTRALFDTANPAEVVFRKYEPDDSPIAARREINQFQPGWQTDADLAMNAAGWFAVTWRSSNQDGSGSGVYARLYAGARPVTGEIQVPANVAGNQWLPRVAIDGAGNFLVVWESPSRVPDEIFDILARRFDRTGKPLGKPYRVNTHTRDFQLDAAVAMRPDGRHVVVWTSRNQDGPGAGVYGQRFNAKGRPVGSELRIHQLPIPSFSARPAVAMSPDGGFTVVWERCDSSDFLAGCAVTARRYDASGRPLSDETTVSFDDADTHIQPKIAFARNGTYAIVWNLCESSPDGSPLACRIATRFYDRQGRPYSSVPIVDSSNSLGSPAVVALGDDFLVAWDSQSCDAIGCGSDPEGVFAQRYQLEP
jgi:hypothetical protein